MNRTPSSVSLDLNSSVFKKMETEEGFVSVVTDVYEELAQSECAMEIEISDIRLRDAYLSMTADLNRLKTESMTGSESTDPDPNHFKRCGFLTYWLRRSSPIIRCQGKNPGSNKILRKKQDFLVKNNFINPQFAFDLGLLICQIFNESDMPLISEEYNQTICYVLKCKSISPHAMVLLFESLFLPKLASATSRA